MIIIQIAKSQSFRLGFLMLAYKDSNLECRYQKPVCYQLHHRPIDFITAANLNQSFYPANVFITFLFLTKFYNLRTLNTALLNVLCLIN